MARRLVVRESDRWVFTINNPSEEEKGKVKSVGDLDDVIAMTVGEEVGEQGTPHLQGYVIFKFKVSRTAVETAIGGRAHLEPMKGSVRQNQAYCSKGGQLLVQKSKIVDREVKQSKRDMYAEILKGARELNPLEFASEYPDHWLLRRSAIERIMIEAQGERCAIWEGDLHNKNYWIWGAPGLGKSRWAAVQNPTPLIYKKNANKWWDGFDPLTHVQVAIEDWSPSYDCLCGHLKIWADRYPFVGEVKGSSFLMEPGKWSLVITSNYSIEDCFNSTDCPAIMRRFSEVHITNENKTLVLASRIQVS
jgi:hypothetical protein